MLCRDELCPGGSLLHPQIWAPWPETVPASPAPCFSSRTIHLIGTSFGVGAPCLLGVVMGASGPQASTMLCAACFPACREGQFGRNCQETCQRAQGCRGLSFCLPDPYGCSCASGWSGSRCNQGTGMWASATRPCLGVPAPMWDHRQTVAGDSSEDFSSHRLSPRILRP